MGKGTTTLRVLFDFSVFFLLFFFFVSFSLTTTKNDEKFSTQSKEAGAGWKKKRFSRRSIFKISLSLSFPHYFLSSPPNLHQLPLPTCMPLFLENHREYIHEYKLHFFNSEPPPSPQHVYFRTVYSQFSMAKSISIGLLKTIILQRVWQRRIYIFKMIVIFVIFMYLLTVLCAREEKKAKMLRVIYPCETAILYNVYLYIIKWKKKKIPSQ